MPLRIHCSGLPPAFGPSVVKTESNGGKISLTTRVKSILRFELDFLQTNGCCKYTKKHMDFSTYTRSLEVSCLRHVPIWKPNSLPSPNTRLSLFSCFASWQNCAVAVSEADHQTIAAGIGFTCQMVNGHGHGIPGCGCPLSRGCRNGRANPTKLPTTAQYGVFASCSFVPYLTSRLCSC